LRDPATNEVRYIGKANDSMKRLKTHIRDSRRRNTPVYSWIKKLASKGLVPTFSKRLWEIKRALGFALKRGELRPHIIEAMRTAATKRPDLFGCWAGITVPENQTAV
jgi:hypothetical protein